jgi:putative oxidoreductase
MKITVAEQVQKYSALEGQMGRGSFDATGLLAPLMLRIPLGIIFMAHGSQKLLGLFGGHGLTATFKAFEDRMAIPPIFTLLAIIAEFGGGFGVLTGFLTRLSAAGISAVMMVAIYKVHWANGLFLNMSCTPGRGHGFEFNLALLGMSLFLVLAGGGQWCLDRLIFKR